MILTAFLVMRSARWPYSYCVIALLLLTAGCNLFTGPAEVQLHSPRRQALEERTRLSVETDDWPEQPQQLPSLEEEALVAPTTASGNTLEFTGTTTQSALNVGAIPVARGQAPDTPNTVGTVAEGDSVASLIGPNSPPSVAAALRCIERGRLLLAAGQVAAAREWFERALTLDGNSVYAYYFLARAAIEAGRYDQAEAFLTRAVTLSAHAQHTWVSRILALQGQVFEAAGRFPEARQAYQQAAQIDPRNTGAQAGLARLSGPR